MKTFLAGAALVSVLFAAVSASAAPPIQDISPYRHGNLAEAQQLTVQAFDRITAAQIDNSYDFGGHAGRAKELLRKANIELKMAAEAANHHQGYSSGGPDFPFRRPRPNARRISEAPLPHFLPLRPGSLGLSHDRCVARLTSREALGLIRENGARSDETAGGHCQKGNVFSEHGVAPGSSGGANGVELPLVGAGSGGHVGVIENHQMGLEGDPERSKFLISQLRRRDRQGALRLGACAGGLLETELEVAHGAPAGGHDGADGV